MPSTATSSIRNGSMKRRRVANCFLLPVSFFVCVIVDFAVGFQLNNTRDAFFIAFEMCRNIGNLCLINARRDFTGG